MIRLCRMMETRMCPKSFSSGCGDLCARFESDDETPWELDAQEFRETFEKRFDNFVVKEVN